MPLPEAFVILGAIGTIASIINITQIALARAKSLAQFLKGCVRASLEGFLVLLGLIESTYKRSLFFLARHPHAQHNTVLALINEFANCLRICRHHASEIDDQLVLIFQSRCRAWTATIAEPQLERHRTSLESAKMNLGLCMTTIRYNCS